MAKLTDKVSIIAIVLISILVFLNWILSPILSAGDSWYQFPSMLNNYFLRPYAWYENSVASGMGSQGFAYVTTFSLMSTVLQIAKLFNLSWETISRLFLYLPYIFISLVSSIFLIRKLFPKNPFWVTAPIIFTFNTYILMVVGGGQLPTALSYSLVPLSLFLFIRLLEINKGEISKYLTLTIASAIIFSLQCILDLRIAFVAGIVLVVYVLFQIISGELRLKNLMFLILSFVFIALINSYWVIPIFLLGINPIEQLGISYSSSEMLKFLSFAKIENTVGLMHPYWPENIFGKVGFMKSEFLILPILAFSALLFIKKNKEETKLVLFFAAIGLIGIFLGKGASEPLGSTYVWLFSNIPGFQLFRDSFKWYALISLSYSILVPYSAWQIYNLLKTKNKFSIFNFQFSNNSKFLNFQNLFIILIFGYLLFLIRPAFLGELGGTFVARSVPHEYQNLNEYLSNDKEFYRTFWVPNTLLFGYYSNTHPQISGRDFLGIYEQEKILNKISTFSAKKNLEEAGVKYVIIPKDTEREIFLTDRKYDDKKYQAAVNALDKIPWLTKDKEFGKVVVYKTDSSKDHFWCDCDAEIKYKFINPTLYELQINNAEEGDRIVFSESFDSKWVAESSKFKVQSSKFGNRFNSFIIPNDGNYSLKIYYSLQRYVDIGVIISVGTLFSLILLLIYSLVKKSRK